MLFPKIPRRFKRTIRVIAMSNGDICTLSSKPGFMNLVALRLAKSIGASSVIQKIEAEMREAGVRCIYYSIDVDAPWGPGKGYIQVNPKMVF